MHILTVPKKHKIPTKIINSELQDAQQAEQRSTVPHFHLQKRHPYYADMVKLIKPEDITAADRRLRKQDRLDAKQSWKRVNKKNVDKSYSALKKNQQHRITKTVNITYNHQLQNQQNRNIILRALSKTVNFEQPPVNQQTSTKLTPEYLLQKLTHIEPLKPLLHTSLKFLEVHKYINYIFGNYFQTNDPKDKNGSISSKDIVVAYGEVTQGYYVFLNGIIRICCMSCSGLIYVVVNEDFGDVREKYKIRDKNFKESRMQISFEEEEEPSQNIIFRKVKTDKINKTAPTAEKSIINANTLPILPPINRFINSISTHQNPSAFAISLSFTCVSCKFTGLKINLQKLSVINLQKVQTIGNEEQKINESVERERFDLSLRKMKKKQKYQEQKYKVELGVLVGSGKFKRMRIIDEDKVQNSKSRCLEQKKTKDMSANVLSKHENYKISQRYSAQPKQSHKDKNLTPPIQQIKQNLKLQKISFTKLIKSSSNESFADRIIKQINSQQMGISNKKQMENMAIALKSQILRRR